MSYFLKMQANLWKMIAACKALWPSGLGNDFMCKRFAVQILLWSLEFLIQINLHHDNIADINNCNQNNNNNKGRRSGLNSEGREFLGLLSWVNATRTASACLNRLALAQYGWKGKGSPIRSSQSTSCELLITDFGS